MGGIGMKLVSSIAVIGLAALLSGCVSGSGARTMPPLGANPPATKISALGGGLIGGSIGQDLKRPDKQRALEAEYRALEYTEGGKTVPWTGSGSERGEVVAAQPYRVGSQDCRQYVHTLYTGTASQTARGTACRNTDGSWTLLS